MKHLFCSEFVQIFKILLYTRIYRNTWMVFCLACRKVLKIYQTMKKLAKFRFCIPNYSSMLQRFHYGILILFSWIKKYTVKNIPGPGIGGS